MAMASSTFTAALVVGCSGDDDGGTTEPTPTIGVAVGAPSVTVVAGQSGSSVVTLTRGGGYSGAVNLTVEGAPAGVTATVNPAAVPNGTTSSTITLATAANTAAGTYALTVRGTGTGVTAVTAPLSLVVTAVPSFTLALNPTSVSVAQGGTATTRVTLARTNFAGAIAAAVSGLPTGVTATTASITGDTATLTLTAAANAAAGPSTATVTGTGTGVSSQTAQLGVTVTAAQQPTPTIAIAATPATVSIAQGTTTPVTATVNITRTGGFAGAVTLAATGQPAGLTVTPSAATTTNSGTLSITATPAVATGTYPVTVTATGTGVANATTTLNVTVTAAVQVGGVTITVSPTTVSLPQGGAATSTVTIARTGGFTGPVDISVTGLPTNVTATIASSLLARGVSADPVTGNTATITFRAAAGAATGAFTFNVVATATGVPTQTVAGTGTVTAGSTGGGNVALAFCAAEAPLWVGYQSEGGPWQRATLGANNQVSVSLSGTRAGIAYVVQSGTTFTTNVIYGTATELNGFGTNLCQNVTGGKTHPGTVAGVPAGGQATITLGNAAASVVTGNAFTLTGVQPGPRDLLAVRSAVVLNGSSFSITPDRVILRRDVNLPNNTPIALDFGAAESFAPASAQLTVTGAAAGESILPFVSLQTANGTGGTFFTGIGGLLGGGSGATQTYYGLPTDRLTASDYHLVTAIAFNTNGTSVDQANGRITGGYFRAVADRSLALSPALSTPTVTVAASAPYVRPRVQLPRQTEYVDAFGATFTQATAGAPRAASITALGSYLQGGTTWDVTFPDLTAAPGFDATWALRPGAATTYSVQASGGTGLTSVGQSPTEGASYRAAFRGGSLATLLRALRR
jgi:hypothetical protein